MSKLRKLTEEQRYFLLALLNTGERGFQSAAQITRLASATYGATYPEKSLPKDVLNAIPKPRTKGFCSLTARA